MQSGIGAVLVVLALYVGTWPVVEKRFSVTSAKPHGGTILQIDGRVVTTTGIVTTTATQDLICTLYRPLHTIRAWNGGDNLLARYWKWCGGL